MIEAVVYTDYAPKELVKSVALVLHFHGWSTCSKRVSLYAHVYSCPIDIVSRTFASAAPSNIIPDMMKEFGFGEEVGALMVAVFIAGYCVGPIVWGPLSEQV